MHITVATESTHTHYWNRQFWEMNPSRAAPSFKDNLSRKSTRRQWTEEKKNFRPLWGEVSMCSHISWLKPFSSCLKKWYKILPLNKSLLTYNSGPPVNKFERSAAASALPHVETKKGVCNNWTWFSCVRLWNSPHHLQKHCHLDNNTTNHQYRNVLATRIFSESRPIHTSDC